ncbi:Lipase [Trema orientale]|uniref:Lipase n=1 Tax=Trema orientale TaxID=63057 RepID=A0A2P5CNF3_TREOI|nr:Lipase [Trema orientale]
MLKSNFHVSYLFVILLCISLVTHTKACYDNHSKAALFVFGDSIFDVGNNDYFPTTIRSNYFPYGETFFKYPTGRFSDGRLIPDFIAEYAKLPLIPPYLQPGFVEYTLGVNFASAGAGALTETNLGSVIDLITQLIYFKKVSLQLRQKPGDVEATTLLSRAVYFVNIGANDYLFIFQTNSPAIRSFSPEEFVRRVISNINFVIQEMYKIGGRKFALINIESLACIPFSRVLAAGKYNESCLDQITPYVQLHNMQLSKLLKKLNRDLIGFRYSLSDGHGFQKEITKFPSRYGIKELNVACCGSGPYKGIFNCGGRRIAKEYSLCVNIDEHIFFDSFHNTERVYQQFAEKAWSGKPNFEGSYNLKALFES